ncbi:MAG: hypothetical protein IJT79_05170 [Ruminococcus sp.]|nr:hypothetical protein [Ruminococcus sp.]
MASENKDIKQEDNIGNPIGDRLWLEHFANALHKTVFNDEEHRKLMQMIDRELSRKYKGKT